MSDLAAVAVVLAWADTTRSELWYVVGTDLKLREAWAQDIEDAPPSWIPDPESRFRFRLIGEFDATVRKYEIPDVAAFAEDA